MLGEDQLIVGEQQEFVMLLGMDMLEKEKMIGLLE